MSADDERYVLIPAGAPEADERLPLLRMWRDLPASPYLLDEIGFADECSVQLAATDLINQKVPLGPHAASLGVMFTRVFDFLSAWYSPDDLGWFACPFVKLDRVGWPRIGFWPPSHSAEHAKRVAPEVIEKWPKMDERGMVYAIGQLMLDVTVMTRDELRNSVALVIRRCVLTDPVRRFAKLKQLRTALIEVGGLSDTRLVVRSFTGGLTAPLPAPLLSLRKSPRSWADVASAGARLEAQRDPRGALALYNAVGDDDGDRVPRYLAVARTSLAVGDYGHAIDYARKLAPSRESLAIEAKGWIAKREPAQALDVIERWDVLAPGDAAVSYQRGKALLLLSRLPEARAAFDQALSRDGKMIEAMLLRREVERHMGKLREAVGTQQQAAVAPELLALIGAEPAAAIDVLSADRFAGDPYAQLMLAELLVGEQRYADALPSYDRAIAELPQARKGKAMALLELGRADDALAALGDAKDMATTELRAWIQAKIKS